MKKTKLIFLIFFSLFLQKKYGYDEDSIFFNILYIASKRSEATMEYFLNFIAFENSVSIIHKKIISSMRNPSKCTQDNIINDYELNQINYMNTVQKTISTYTLYSTICNNFTDLLSNEKKEVLQNQKEIIAHVLLKEIVNLENIIILVKNFFNSLEDLDDKNLMNMEDIKNIFIKIAQSLEIYFYFKKMYVNFDNVLLKKYDYFIKIKKLFNSYYKQFWFMIERKRLSETIKNYNFYMDAYIKKNNKQIKKIVFSKNNQLDFIEEYLPDKLSSNFL